MPRIYRVIILPTAFDDLDGIFDFIKLNSPQNAARVVNLLYTAAHSLDQFPHRYKIHRRAKRASNAIRPMPVPPFVIYYGIDELKAIIRILTIRHGAGRPLQ